MHVYFSGIGGAGIGPLALIAHQAGFTVSGSDKQPSSYLDQLRTRGINAIHIGQEYDQIAAVYAEKKIDWLVYTSALPMEQPDAPELTFAREHGIKATKRDDFLSYFLEAKNLKLIAVAGTHGKTTTTAMAVWLMKQLNLPVSYSVGAKLSFGDMGEFNPASTYFLYEADEFDRNFLSFHPYMSLITGLDWDHPDIYPTRESYNDAFRQFLKQSAWSTLWQADAATLDLAPNHQLTILNEHNPEIDTRITLPGRVNRLDAWLVANALCNLTNSPLQPLLDHLNNFPGVSRRFEQIVPGLYTDYAHTPPKIRGALQLAHEVARNNVVVVYEGLHNTRQHFIKDELTTLFEGVKQLYVVPNYLAREDPTLPMLDPEHMLGLMNDKTQAHGQPAALDESLDLAIRRHLENGDVVVAFSAGGGNSLDTWLRQHFTN